MDANEFWCRAYLVAMGEHVRDLERCEEVANAALWRAQRRGMVTGERAASAPAAEPELERVEFTAELTDYGNWIMRAPEWGGAVCVTPGFGSIAYRGDMFRIKWGDTMPPKPIEVWLERR
jgi:hypothetical protein